MPFGLSDAESMFQRMGNTIFQDLINEGVVLVHLDDILIHTSAIAMEEMSVGCDIVEVLGIYHFSHWH